MSPTTIKEFLDSINQIKRAQARNKCPISNKNYYRKASYKDIVKTLYKTEQVLLEDWAEGRNLDAIYVIVMYVDVDSCMFAVDEDKKEFQDITDYNLW